MVAFFNTLRNVWTLFFGWMPTTLAVFCTAVVGLLAIILIIKLIAFVLDAIPFL